MTSTKESRPATAANEIVDLFDESGSHHIDSGLENKSPRDKEKTGNVTQQEFLKAVFRDMDSSKEQIWIAQFKGNPKGEGQWKGRGHTLDTLPEFNERCNQYFSITTQKDSSDSRTKENAVRRYVVVLDDVGTKVKAELPDIIPSWEIETSPGNFQVGFILLHPVGSKDAGKYDRLLQGLIDAGYSDPGSKDAVHLFRLPGGVHGGRKLDDGTEHQVTAKAWNPDARYSLEQLAEAFEIPLTGTKRAAPVIPDKDAYLEALDSLGVVTGKKINDHGWIDIVCPWYESHTQRAKTGAAYRIGGGFRCHHGHCKDRHFHDLRVWMAGQKVDVEELDRKMEDAGNYVKGLIYRYVYDESGHRYYDLKERKWIGIEPLNVVHKSKVKWPIHQLFAARDELNKVSKATYVPKGLPWERLFDESGKPLPTSARMLEAKGYHAPYDTTFIPDPVNPYETKVLNYWKPGPVQPRRDFDPEVVQPWLDHLHWMFPDPADAQAVLDFLTFVVSFRGTKANFALLLVAEVQGTGRDTLLAPVLNILGQDNCSQPNAQMLEKEFNSYLQSELMVCSELDAGDRSKVKIYNQLKEVITTPPEHYLMERKGLDAIKVKKTANLIINSNDPRALILDDKDRRFDVRKSPRTREEVLEYTASGVFRRLHKQYEKIENGEKVMDQEYHAHLYGFLLQNPISTGFDPKGRAQDSRAKKEMIEDSASRVDQCIKEALETQSGPFQYVLVELEEVEQFLRDKRIEFKGRQAELAVGRAGCRKYPKQVKMGKDDVRRFWITRDVEAWVERPGVDLKRQYNTERSDFNDPLFD
jgi:hypothetical protein